MGRVSGCGFTSILLVVHSPTVGDIVTFRQDDGLTRTWVPKAEEAWWIRFWGRGGVSAARWTDYLRWGRRFYPTDSADRVMLRRRRRRRTNYAQWDGYR